MRRAIFDSTVRPATRDVKTVERGPSQAIGHVFRHEEERFTFEQILVNLT